MGKCIAQTGNVKELPEFVYIPPAPQRYEWERVYQIKGRTLWVNAIACTDSVVYSFGGRNTLMVKREMNQFWDGKIRKDSIDYPGKGFIQNLFFIRDSIMYIGGGHDSGASRYAYSDFWQYNLNTHTWKRLKDLPFYYRHPPAVFTEGNRIIILLPQLAGLDFNQTVPIFYEYHPGADSWNSISKGLPAEHLLYPVAFRIDDDIFVLFAFEGNPTNVHNSFYKFNLHSGQWTAMPSFPGRSKAFAFAFGDGNYGYTGGGAMSIYGNSREVFRFDPQKEKWETITSLPRGVRHAKGWMYKGEGYVGFGINDKENSVVIWKLKLK